MAAAKPPRKESKMKMKHTIRLKSESEAVYEFQTKAASKQALKNAKTLTLLLMVLLK